MSIAEQLRQRGVLQTAALYVAIAWGGTEIIAFLAEALFGEHTASVVSKYLAILFIAGFPVAMYLAWTRDLGLQGRRLLVAAALAVCLVAFLSWLVPEDRRPESAARPAPSPGVVNSLAVLPLDNLSAQPDEDYFASGLTDVLIAELSRLNVFKVISRTSVMRYRDTSKTLPEIAGELGVDAIVEGSVVRVGNRVRVSAQLIEAATDHHLWSDTFESEIEDVLALQQEAAHEIARGIGAEITRAAAVAPKREHQPLSEEALDAYLRARILYLEAPSQPEEAIAAMERVIELAPDFAPGYALLADLYGYLALITNVTHGDAYLRARQLAQRAVQLDPSLADAHISMGRVHFQFEWDWDAAQREFETMLELDPNNSIGLAMYGSYRVLVHKDCESGIDLIEQALDRDPLNPNLHFDLGIYGFHCRYPDASIRALDRTIELAPQFLYAKLVRAWSTSMLGMHEQAAEQCDALKPETAERFDVMFYIGCTWVYQRAGDTDSARIQVARLLQPPDGAYVDPVMLAFACASIEDIECALDNLERGYRERSSNLIFLQTGPAFDSIRDLPRFRRILDQMGFPER